MDISPLHLQTDQLQFIQYRDTKIPIRNTGRSLLYLVIYTFLFFCSPSRFSRDFSRSSRELLDCANRMIDLEHVTALGEQDMVYRAAGRNLQ
jgi:hypothetical protein